MKLLLSLFFLALYVSGASQDVGVQKPKIQYYIPKAKPLQMQDLLLRNDTINYPHQLAKGKIRPGVYRLRQDNMPCKVPDTNQIAGIPNSSPVTLPFKSGIPNPSTYYRSDSSLFQERVQTFR